MRLTVSSVFILPDVTVSKILKSTHVFPYSCSEIFFMIGELIDNQIVIFDSSINQSIKSFEFNFDLKDSASRRNFSATVVEAKRIILIIKACAIADSHPVKRALHTKDEDSRIYAVNLMKRMRAMTIKNLYLWYKL